MLEVTRVSKSFRAPRSRGTDRRRATAGLVHALKPVSFTARPGEVMGVLGANGAGKTTLLRVLSTALRPSSGSATFDGVDIVSRPEAIRARLGFLSGTTGVYGRLSPAQMLHYFGELHRMPVARRRARVDELLALFGLADVAGRRCDQLSTGMRQKVSIARTIVHDPDFIVLDEPTTGLDLLAARGIFDLVQQLRASGKVVLLSTHHLHEVEQLCDRAVVLAHGRLRFCGSLAELRGRSPSARLSEALIELLDDEVSHAA
jgi:sodium transport system ATP-binding protein